MTRRRALCSVLGLAVLLAALRSAAVPEWYPDAQYYVQAGRLFRQGTVTFAGNLVGDRHLAIGYYQIFQALFGPSADSVAIALSVAFGAAACLIATLCFIAADGAWRPALIAVSLIVVLSLMPIWNSTLTDPLLLVLVLLVLNGVACLSRDFPSWLVMVGIGALCGFGYGVRPETVVMLIAVALSSLLLNWRGVSTSGRELVVLVASFTAGFMLQSAAWYAWIPAPKPDTYSAAFAFYLPMYYNAEPSDGPATAALDRLEESAGLPLTTKYIGLFPVMAAGVKAHAVKETDRLIAQAGIELLEAKPRRLLVMFARDGALYLTYPKLDLERHTDPWDQRWTFMRGRLQALDQRREETSALFGNDAWWRTATLGDQHLPLVVRLRSWLPPWTMVLRLPGVVILCGFAATLVSLVFRRQQSNATLTACLFVLGAFVVTNFSQGFDARYSEIWRYLSLVMVGLTILAWPGRRPYAS
jgi:hypothetical protein